MESEYTGWEKYHEATKDRPPSALAVKALKEAGKSEGKMIDLGCGAGVDSVFFLQNGWSVLAIDRRTELFSDLCRTMPDNIQNRLEIRKMSFEELHLTEPADCILANFSIPFCHPSRFYEMWREILGGLLNGGIFAGVFFGDRDEGALTYADRWTFLSKDRLLDLMKPLEIISLEEREFDGTHQGKGGEREPWHWHIFEVIAKKQDR